MRNTAQLLDTDHPETVAGDHVRDAAKVLEHGSTEGATRHLDAAMDILTPRNLIRHGILDDDGHSSAKHHLHLVNRHKLAVLDIADAHTKNQEIAAALRTSRETIAATRAAASQPGRPASPPQPAPPAGPQLSNTVELRNVSKELRDFRGRWSVSGSVPAAGTSASPLGRKVSRKEMLGGLEYMAARRGTMTMEGHQPPGFAGRPGSVFGKRLSTREAIGAASALAPPPLPKSGLHPGQQAQLDSLTKSQRVIYKKLRARGRAHAGAFLIARKFQPGMLQSAVLANRRAAILLAEAWRIERRGPGGRWIRSAREMTAGELRDHLDRYHSGGELPRGHGFRARGRSALFVHHQYMHRGADVTVAHSHGRRAPQPVLRPAAALATELSARTALLERTPAPRGKPGGPGLYDVKGLGHTAYLQQIVKALIEKRGMPPSRAYAIARGAIRKWGRGGGHVHPEVRAAAARAETGEVARQARAHTHTSGWAVADVLIELAADPPMAIELFNPNHAPPGAGGGQFVAAGAGAQGKQGKAAQLRRKIAALRHQIAGLEKQYRALTGRSHPKKITAAAKKAGKAQTPQQAAAAARASAKAKKTTATPRKKGPSAATIHLKILALRAEMKGYIAQLRAL